MKFLAHAWRLTIFQACFAYLRPLGWLMTYFSNAIHNFGSMWWSTRVISLNVIFSQDKHFCNHHFCCFLSKELISLSTLRICQSLLGTQITNDSNISNGKICCHSMLEESGLWLVLLQSIFHSCLAATANLISLLSLCTVCIIRKSSAIPIFS